jgi:hypothetical protein
MGKAGYHKRRQEGFLATPKGYFKGEEENANEKICNYIIYPCVKPFAAVIRLRHANASAASYGSA